MRAMILAAGLGTRLRPVTDELPKALVPVVGVPNIVRLISHLQSQGIDEIVINTHHLGEALISALGNGSELGVAIRYSREKELLGTGGGIKKALPLLGGTAFLVINADAVFTPDIHMVLEAHQRSRALATMLVRDDPDAETFGAVGLDREGCVQSLVWAGDPSRACKKYMFTGWHVLEPAVGDRLPDKGCIVRETYIPMLEMEQRINGVPVGGYFSDLGTPARYLRANVSLVTGKERIPGAEPSPDGVYVGPHVTLGENCRLEPGTVVCHGARISSGVRLERTVVLAGARVTRDLSDSIVTSTGKIVTIEDY